MAAMTLEETKKGMGRKGVQQIVDIFLLPVLPILSVLPFDDCVSASGGGSTMKYKYLRKVLPATAQFRKIGAATPARRRHQAGMRSQLALWGQRHRTGC